MRRTTFTRWIVVPSFAVAVAVVAGCGSPSHQAVPPPAPHAYSVPLPDLNDPAVRKQFACTTEDGWYHSVPMQPTTTTPATFCG